jgi:hypothetical protein
VTHSLAKLSAYFFASFFTLIKESQFPYPLTSSLLARKARKSYKKNLAFAKVKKKAKMKK